MFSTGVDVVMYAAGEGLDPKIKALDTVPS
jgi:hypothetical protein